MTPSRAEAGAKSTRAGGWRTEPCTAWLTFSQRTGAVVICQRPRTFQGDLERGHLLHLYRGLIDGHKVEITWQDPP